MRSKANRTVAAVTAAALALPTAGVAPAFAASKSAKNATVSAASDTEFSSSHRYRGHRYRNNAAGAAAFAAIIGGIATYAAAREYRKSRERAGSPFFRSCTAANRRSSESVIPTTILPSPQQDVNE